MKVTSLLLSHVYIRYNWGNASHQIYTIKHAHIVKIASYASGRYSKIGITFGDRWSVLRENELYPRMNYLPIIADIWSSANIQYTDMRMEVDTVRDHFESRPIAAIATCALCGESGVEWFNDLVRTSFFICYLEPLKVHGNKSRSMNQIIWILITGLDKVWSQHVTE